MATGLAMGVYFVTVTDANNCQAVDSVTVSGGSPSGPPGVWTWTGVADSNWFNVCNWDKLALPDTASQVMIPGGTPFHPRIMADTAYCKVITIMVSNLGHNFIDVASGGFLVKKP